MDWPVGTRKHGCGREVVVMACSIQIAGNSADKKANERAFCRIYYFNFCFFTTEREPLLRGSDH